VTVDLKCDNPNAARCACGHTLGKHQGRRVGNEWRATACCVGGISAVCPCAQYTEQPKKGNHR
jgi:hypothetical protein